MGTYLYRFCVWDWAWTIPVKSRMHIFVWKSSEVEIWSVLFLLVNIFQVYLRFIKYQNAFLCAIMVYLIHLCFLKTSPPKIIVCLASRKLLPNYEFLYQLLKSLDIDDFMIDSFLITFTGEWGLNIIIFIFVKSSNIDNPCISTTG